MDSKKMEAVESILLVKCWLLLAELGFLYKRGYENSPIKNIIVDCHRSFSVNGFLVFVKCHLLLASRDY